MIVLGVVHRGDEDATIREGPDFTLYRGRQHGNRSTVLAIAASAKQPSPQSLRRLEHEYSLAAELDPAWAARPLALTRHEGRTILVLEDPGGEPLDQVLERTQGQPLDLTRFLCVAVNLASALGQVHRHGLIHKDIKPANVLVDEAGNVWLTDFGIASQLPREHQSPVPPEIIAGTLAYMAPEQTGRMNRSMDARSDLYSLGITLYEMLTGTLPFAAADPLEWVHCQIAREPVSPGERVAVPEPLSSLTMKLLAKNPEERYQTASGLKADLRWCLEQWQPDGRIDGFPLGAHDASDRLLIPEKLYGREGEIDVLLAAFDRVVSYGTPELVLVSGYSGVGKSSVVNELHQVLVPPRGLFASGKFDQYKRDIPYATLAQAFQTLSRQVLVKSEAEVERWRGSLQEAVGPNGQFIVNLIPELEFIIGKQPPVAELPPRDAQNRFQLVFRRFLGAFARPEHPLTLFLDDLQWLDAASLELIEYLVTHSEVRHLLLVGAYRDNEVGFAHPLMPTLEAIRKAGARIEEIALPPLGLDGFTHEEWRSSNFGSFVHPEDRERFRNETRSKFSSGVPHETEVRSLGKDGTYRWFLYRWNPLRDEQGRLIRWYVAATDIEDRKQAEQRLQNENVALREEIDKASMFEEIVGTSRSLQTVLSLISKVAPTDSSVLVTGETGTGKELVARAIHKRSRRSSRPFVGVNCAAIPRDLIGSELFSHEKGAFTGALQRRIGCFELAEGGTIFLDEIGELPAETQIALLRVLQEHEFQRVGGAGTIRTNVRVIAATNRDLEGAIAAGTFRSDLYYRLNVFPIEMPPLRERREDIPLLVEYFIDRFARKTGKSFQTVSRKSLALLESYPWPGNIRELQNVIERSVIVCETENFSVDERWLSRQPPATEPNTGLSLFRKVPSQEKAIIEAALRESGGQVYGPGGAVSKLGMPRSTLESKIRSLKINKNRFKSTNPFLGK